MYDTRKQKLISLHANSGAQRVVKEFLSGRAHVPQNDIGCDHQRGNRRWRQQRVAHYTLTPAALTYIGVGLTDRYDAPATPIPRIAPRSFSNYKTQQ
jgi:hypothetical protein